MEDEVKLEQEQLRLPMRSMKTIDQLKYHKLNTNMVEIAIGKECNSIYMYKVVSQPILPNYDGTTKYLIAYINKRIGDYLHKFTYVSSNIIITTTKFQSDRSLKLVYGNSPYQVWLLRHKQISFQALKQSYFLSPDHRKSKSYFSRVTKKVLSLLNLTNYRNNHYIPQLQYNQLVNSSILRVYNTSYLYQNKSLLLNVKHSSMIIQENNVLDQINSYYKQQSSLSKQQKRIYLNDSYKDKRIIASYGKKSIYHIEQILFGKSITQIYVSYNNKPVSLPKYYELKYQIIINNFNQPLIKAKSKQTIYLIPQLMSFIINHKEFDLDKRRLIRKHTQISPKQHIQQNQNFLMNLKEPIKQNRFQTLSKIGIEMKQFAEVNAYQLDLPTIRMKEKKFSFEDQQIYDGSIDLNICLICSNEFSLNNLKNNIIRFASKCGISHNFISYTYLSNTKDHVVYDIKKIVYLQKYTSRKNATNIFWIIIPSSLKQIYSTLKQITLSPNIEIITQITLENTVSINRNSAIVQKILYQMAAKVGNKLWVIDNIIPKPILMIGIGTKQTDKRQRIVTCCSNLNSSVSIFNSNFYVQQLYQSLSFLIKKIVEQSIFGFFNVNQTYPHQIIILRFQDTKISRQQQAAQVRQIQKAVNSIKARDKARINYYALSYSNSLQLYLKTGNSYIKPFQGLLIDGQIADDGSFYIIHQNKTQSQTNIILYRRIYSNSLIHSIDLQQLMYNQTFNYFNFKGSTNIPSVLKYSQKLSNSLINYEYTNLQLGALRHNLYFL